MSPPARHSPSPSELAARNQAAAQGAWEFEDGHVSMLNLESAEARDLRSLLQSLGLDVHAGVDLQKDVEVPVIMIPAADWRKVAFRQKAEALRRRLPLAIICVVTGAIVQREWTGKQCRPRFDDARALLQSAGMGFFSLEGSRNELSA
mgnify:CR=1 FL=1